MPGTTFFIAPGQSIFFYGKVEAVGTQNKPIRFLPHTPGKPWGIVAVQGRNATGSRFSYCHFYDGSIDKRNLIHYTAQFNIHDLDRFSVSNCIIGPNHKGDDSMHVAYANGTIENCIFYNARSDALDVDIGTIAVKDSLFLGSGNDALDFMTSTVEVENSIFVDAGDKGISTGEWSRGNYHNNLFLRCAIAIEIKDKSEVYLGRNLLMKMKNKAINLYNKNPRYGSGGSMKADVIYIADGRRDITKDSRSVVNLDEVIYNYPDISEFGFITRRFPDLNDWQDLDNELLSIEHSLKSSSNPMQVQGRHTPAGHRVRQRLAIK